MGNALNLSAEGRAVSSTPQPFYQPLVGGWFTNLWLASSTPSTIPMDNIKTLGALKATGYKSKSIKDALYL